MAVLEFDSRVMDAGRSHLAPAVTAQLRSHLAEIPGVVVETRGTVERVFNASGGRIDSLQSKLGNQFAVVGNVIPQRDRIDITVRILQVREGRLRWERVFAYPRTSLRQVVESVAEGVAQISQSRVPPALLGMSSDAYEITVRGDYFLAQHEPVRPTPPGETTSVPSPPILVRRFPIARAARARVALLERSREEPMTEPWANMCSRAYRSRMLREEGQRQRRSLDRSGGPVAISQSGDLRRRRRRP